MMFATQFLTFRRLSILATCAALAACGGGGADSNTATSPVAAAPADVPALTAATVTTASATAAAATTTTAVSAVAITDVRFQNTDSSNVQTSTPFTFGQPFAVGQVSPSDVITGRLEDGTIVPLQMDVKATHADGSVRHAIISGILPTVAANTTRTMGLVKGGTAPTTTTGTISSLLKAGFTASFHAKINGVDYYASADDLLKVATATSWLKGGVANEWQVAAPLHTADGTQHPHLAARFAVRWYDSVKKARVDVTVENDWAYEPNPSKFTYDASILVGGQTVYSRADFTHLHHSRWRKVYWFNGTEPTVSVKHNVAYLIGTRALPNFDQSLTIPSDAIATIANNWKSSSTEPMGNGLITGYMPMTGGRDDIGLLPNWAATYLLSQDADLRNITLRTADLAGSFSAHYRDKKTGRPVSLSDYPYMTIAGNYGDTWNPTTNKMEAFPGCAGQGMCDSPYSHDVSHQPSMAYLPYLVSGDYYYLEELQFWAMWDAFETNPNYRNNVQGIMQSEQVRGQGWALRTIAEAAYISPDKDTLKTTFNNIVNNNLDWYTNTYINDKNANKLGVIVNGYAFAYNDGHGIAPWQDDFFTSAIGHIAELGFTKANNLLTWKVQYPISRMVGSGACWIDAAMYSMAVQDTNGTMFTTIGQAYNASHSSDIDALPCNSAAMAKAWNLQLNEMNNLGPFTMGYPANMQPALAYSADVGGTSGKSAWALFMTRANKPDYRYGPQFAIVPR
ncbi:hypothetical protein [Massilia sp. 9096]|uniref:RIFT barrel domain-containing protein n=1 Tax=Massilia sp. 9096 TaxID=1500894 RepID=UPI000A5D52F3|nr:hypothetical protein [Massilia sp. 9096]